MNPVVFHIVSGDAFFSGVGMLLLVVVMSWRSSARMAASAWARLVLLLLFICGVLGIVFSSTPMPLWRAGILLLATLAWCGSLKWSKARPAASWAMIFCWLCCVVMEIPWRALPETTTVPVNAITVIGDSVSAGMEEGEAETWPSLLARQHSVTVQNLSHVGETAGSAFKRVRKLGAQHNWVIAEIGGNDILGSTSPSQFESDLESLLSELRQNDRTVVMFELPLIPLYHRYGMTQRRLAKKYEVALIPKRYFLNVLADSDATLDSIHLSQAGHQKMSDLVWRLSRPPVF